MKHIAGGWTVGGILEFRSGFTLPVSSTTANPGARPDILVSHAAAINNNWGTNQLSYLDPSAFALPPTDEFGVNLRPGTLSRRALYGPGFGNLDLVLQKNIYLKERQRLQFRIDFYNMFNTVNFTRVNTNARSSGLGLLNRVAPPATRSVDVSVLVLVRVSSVSPTGSRLRSRLPFSFGVLGIWSC